MSQKWFSPKPPEPKEPLSQEELPPQSEQAPEQKAAEPLRQGADVIKTPGTPKSFGLYAWSLMEQKREQILHGDFKNADDMRRDIFPHAMVFTIRRLHEDIAEIKKELGI